MKRKGLTILISLIYMVTFILSSGCSNTKKPSAEANPTIAPTDIVQTNNSPFGTPDFAYDLSQNSVEVPYAPMSFEKSVKPYTIKADLSNIENAKQFGGFTNEQMQMLSKNGFVVTPTNEEQLFYIYEKNEYLKVPSFISADSVLQVYHTFYDYSLRTLEYSKLLSLTGQLTSSMLKKAIYLYNNTKNTEVKNAELKNVAYFAVAQMALGNQLPADIPADAKKLAESEFELIKGAGGFQKSVIFPYKLDYSQYIPRGHYTRNEELKKYFITMMWYGQAPFPLYKNTESKERNIEQTLQAILLTYMLFQNNSDASVKDVELWDKVYSPTVFYVGKTDDLNAFEYKDIIVKVYGKGMNIEELDNSSKLDEFYKEADKLPEPQIKAKYTEVDTPVGKQFRLMGQRYIPDSEIMQELVEPLQRGLPNGLDVMGVLGSDRAYEILTKRLGEDKKWDKYIEMFNKMKSKFAALPENTWRSNMYYGWLWVLKSFTAAFGSGYPSFMANTAWLDKSLSTALGSWSELRHDTILYGKQSGAECGGGEEPPQIKGYVEPNIEVYQKLLWLTKYSRENLEKKQILTDDIKSRMSSFEDLLTFLTNCSIKELKNEELTKEEYYQLLTYGGMLEYLTSSLAEEGTRWFEITSETDKNMAVIADVHTLAPNKYSDGGYMEVGVGNADEMYVVVPIGGKLYLTRGAVFSYYEFTSKKRLTDEEWQKSIKQNKQPERPVWTDTFIKGKKESVPVPKEPYNSGC